MSENKWEKLIGKYHKALMADWEKKEKEKRKKECDSKETKSETEK